MTEKRITVATPLSVSHGSASRRIEAARQVKLRESACRHEPAQDVHRRVRVLQRQLEVSLGAQIRQCRWSRPCCFQQVWIHALVDDMERRFSTVAAFAPGGNHVGDLP